MAICVESIPASTLNHGTISARKGRLRCVDRRENTGGTIELMTRLKKYLIITVQFVHLFATCRLLKHVCLVILHVVAAMLEICLLRKGPCIGLRFFTTTYHLKVSCCLERRYPFYELPPIPGTASLPPPPSHVSNGTSPNLNVPNRCTCWRLRNDSIA